jgi:hypothetical protein
MSKEKTDKTVTCKVCGKEFPRGLKDLKRHSTAITLLHEVSEEKTSKFFVKCSKCRLFFASHEHYNMHVSVFKCRKLHNNHDSERSTQDSPPTSKTMPESGHTNVSEKHSEEANPASDTLDEVQRTLECK